ncbi:MAG: hypothetical protein NTU83_10825, partial [Candidatus Hydrogenedentes bacterium]|nr:hypothetical protein [Candidatus Hydrogenedentota bacterium]
NAEAAKLSTFPPMSTKEKEPKRKDLLRRRFRYSSLTESTYKKQRKAVDDARAGRGKPRDGATRDG